MSYREVIDTMFKDGDIEVKSVDEAYLQANWVINAAVKNGLELSDEQLKYIMFDAEKLICRACAGAGKTTMTQLKNLRYEKFFGYTRDRILNLVYNEHAKDDIKYKFMKLAKSMGLDWQTPIQAKTFHSLALEWIKEYRSFLGFKKMDILDDAGQSNYLKASIKKAGVTTVTEELIRKVSLFYNFAYETELSVEKWEDDYVFKSLALSVECVQDIFTKYESIKFGLSKVDFVDQIRFFKKLFDTNPEFRARFGSYYDVIASDEYQDFSDMLDNTVLMMDVKKRIVIGDIRQAIYEFRGANPYKDFEAKYGGKGVTLLTNRRCSSEIVKASNKILKLNKLTTSEETTYLKEGGSVKLIGYSGLEEEVAMIIAELKTVKNIDDTVICFRNREQSSYLTYKLLQEGVPFRLGNVKAPLTDLLSKSLCDIFGMMADPTNAYYQGQCLFKLLPALRKNIIGKITKENEKQYKVIEFWNLDFPEEVKATRGFKESLNDLKIIYGKLRQGTPVSEVFEWLFSQFKKYYWTYMGVDFSPELQREIIKLFNIPEKLNVLNGIIENLAKKINSNLIGVGGPYLTTFHGLKGLEFENVFVMNLNEEILPNKQGLLKYGNQYQEMYEACNRLMYVVITRAKIRLFMFFDKSDPSSYKYVLNDEVVLSSDQESVTPKFKFSNLYSNEDLKDIFEELDI